MKGLLRAPLILGIALSLNACSFSRPAVRLAPVLAGHALPPGQAYGESGRFGGSATWGNLDDPKTFNPSVISESSSIAVAWHLFDPLCEEVGDTMEIRPALAEKWKISRDGRRYLFTLRRGLQWSDGQPLTSDDLMFTFREVMFNPEVPAASDNLKISQAGKAVFPKIRQVDALTIEFTLPKPYAPFLRALASVFIVPRHALGKFKKNYAQAWGIDTPLEQIVGSGAFVLQEFAPAQRVVFRRNPYYWRFDKKNRRLPYLEHLVYSFSKDISGLTVKFLSKEIDAVGARGRQYELLKPLEKAQNFRILNAGPDIETPFVMFNLNRCRDKKGKFFVDPIKQEWFNEVLFRRAFAHVIDKATIVSNAYNFIALPQAGEFGSRHPFHDPSLKGYSYDLDLAGKLLKQAGFSKGEDGRLFDKKGHPVAFDLTTFTGNPLAVQIPTLIKTDLAKLGITLNVRPVQFNTCVEKIDSSYEWDTMFLNWTAGVEPNTSAALWKTNGGSHFFRPKGAIAPWEAAIDDLMEQGAITVDPGKRKEIYGKVQRIVLEQVPMIFLVAPLYLVAVRSDLRNVRPGAFNSSVPSCWNSYEIFRDRGGKK